ncbi:MAG: cytochrome c3 family protein [Melioribacteraceae bacterium]|nr:cytochrome c3 family protein [Melioribacteraceae bacterium]MCF8263677.1 cytochrome c3 family protein [Melioribacteraceae bacterium]MCF8431077.1 cytochrome c3 family protein [Melioribacteraceae bacterium]
MIAEFSRKLLIMLVLTTFAVQGQDFECLDCHDNLIEKSSAHFEVIECGDCHSDVEDEEHMDTGAAKVKCADCHDEYAENYKSNIHFRLGDKVPNPPDCKSCHGEHEIVSPSLVKNKVKYYCSDCHAGNVVLANPYHTEAVSENICADCHDIDEPNLQLTNSVHSDLECADCHNYISNNLEDHPDNVSFKQTADCYLCHNDVALIHRESIHGISLEEGVEEAAQCWDCHNGHNVVHVKDPASPVAPKNITATCATCHDDSQMAQKFNIAIENPGEMYSLSVHGKKNAEGLEAANCVSCHGGHDIYTVINPKSSISPYNLPETCGKCHADQTDEYTQSIHWIRALKGERMSPICNDCHSEHQIEEIHGDDAQAAINLLQEQTCFECHESSIIAKRYGKKSGEPNLYRDSYHGLAVMRGDKDAAMCIDCHGVHKILPNEHPESEVGDLKVTETCQKCHPEATEVFSKSYSHRSTSEEAAKVESIVTNLYFWLIVLVIGGMVVHNLLIFVYEIKNKRKKEKNVIVIPRFSKNEVVQHFLLLTTFITLVITGFALKFPNSFWASGLLELGMIEPVRQIVHRVAGVLMLLVGFYHVFYLFVTARGRDVLKELLPKLDDARHAMDNILYYTRIRKEKPKFNQYDYAEKAEYWALIWGTFVMGVTGFILWFPTIIGDWAPVWFIKVSEIIHYYEAILASLAILVWHWFFVIFHPGEYPMSFTWIDGNMSLTHYRKHHEGHFRRLLLNWYENKNNDKKLNNYTKMVFKKFEEFGLKADDVFNNELINDPELRFWLDSVTEKKTDNYFDNE